MLASYHWTPTPLAAHVVALATDGAAACVALADGRVLHSPDGGVGSVDDPVSLYVPEWRAGADSAVTLRHLLTMTAGLDPLRAPSP